MNQDMANENGNLLKVESLKTYFAIKKGLYYPCWISCEVVPYYLPLVSLQIIRLGKLVHVNFSTYLKSTDTQGDAYYS